MRCVGITGSLDESLLLRLALPFGRPYRRAHNAKTALERHQAAFYLGEAALKLLGSVAVVEFAALGDQDPDLAERFKDLARPSLGHWRESVRRLLPVLAESKASEEPFRKGRDLVLGRRRDDVPRAAGLDGLLRETLASSAGARTTTGKRHTLSLFMTNRMVIAALLAIVAAGEAAAPPEFRDIDSDTWVATDALFRTVPGHEVAGPPRVGKFVCMFYFLWHGSHVRGGPYDVTKILAGDPRALDDRDHPAWGPLHASHHWGESIFGYYLTDDEYVLRKHAQMLSDAGIDAIIFDVTNQLTYKPYYLALLRVFDDFRRRGNRAPHVAFLCPFGDPPRVVAELYRDLYAPGLYPELWFRWEGKPLILADRARIDPSSAEILEFFTFRKPQPDYFRGPTEPDMWSWLEVYPQHVFKNSRGEKEQMSVGVAQNAVGNRLGAMSEPGARGRSFHGGATAAEPDAVLHGYNVAEQWARALGEDPTCIFVTGWNEWIAGRFDEFNGVRRPVMFVDQFDQEHSRDIEPMRGGHGDNYYYQMVGYIRRFKGARPLCAVAPRPIAIDGRFDDWPAAAPEFRDTVGDTAHRNHAGWNSYATLATATGRNDIVAAKVSRDRDHVYFYARTDRALTPHSDPNWMLLFIDADQNGRTGWLGYDIAVNRTASGSPSRSAVERAEERGYRWRAVGDAARAAAGCELELAVPRSVLDEKASPAGLDFKWADSIEQTGEWSDFTLNGDVAPNDRFNYRAKW